jgi:hypothetical protein
MVMYFVFIYEKNETCQNCSKNGVRGKKENNGGGKSN